jgi:hypothetical protein
VALELEALFDRTLMVVKASLFASFFAGFAIGLAMMLTMWVMAIYENGPPPFDCSSIQLCGKSFANTALIVVLGVVGTLGLSLFGAIMGFLFALPMAVIMGCILSVLGRGRRSFWQNRWLLLAVGALAGMLWGCVLTHFSALPFPLNGYLGDEPRELDMFRLPTIPALILFGIGGLASAEMFRRWMLTELPE